MRLDKESGLQIIHPAFTSTAGHNDEGVGILNQQRLAHEEVIHVHVTTSRNMFGFCSFGRTIPQPTDLPLTSFCSAIGGFHNSRTAARHDGESQNRAIAANPSSGRARSSCGLDSVTRADPKTVTQGPTKCSTRNPRRKSTITRSRVMNSSKRERGPSRKISSARSGGAVSAEVPPGRRFLLPHSAFHRPNAFNANDALEDDQTKVLGDCSSNVFRIHSRSREVASESSSVVLRGILRAWGELHSAATNLQSEVSTGS